MRTPKTTLTCLLFLAGVLFLIASPQYAIATDKAASGSMIAGVCGLPAMLFCSAGLVGVLAPVVVLLVELNRMFNRPPPAS